MVVWGFCLLRIGGTACLGFPQSFLVFEFLIYGPTLVRNITIYDDVSNCPVVIISLPQMSEM